MFTIDSINVNSKQTHQHEKLPKPPRFRVHQTLFRSSCDFPKVVVTNMEGDNLELLLQTLEDYGIPFDRNAVKSDYARSPAAVEAWISKYLGPETLLTKDEVAL